MGETQYMSIEKMINDYKVYVAAIVEHNGQVLVGKAGESKVFIVNGWHLPGGKLEEDESGEKAIIREIREEAGIKIRVNEFLGEKIIPKRKMKVKWYLCVALTNNLKASDDLVEVKFLPKTEIAKICDPEAIALWPPKVVEYFKKKD